MKTLPLIAVGALALSATSVIAPTAAGAATIDETFSFTGSTVEWTVPDDVIEITVEAFGAEGGDSAAAGFDDDTGIQTAGPGPGGLGGTTTATIEVTPGETLTLAVGGQGGDGAAAIVEGVDDADAAITATATSGEAGFNGGGCGFAGAAATSTQDTADFGGTQCGGTDSASNDHGEEGEIAAVAAASGGGGGATT
ncbi:MAG: hypothetical protein OSA99_08665, partial [Acidimicrobiales bacterium]|nr:hypothetical protein [Acidimicrobiales bacterium]